MTFSKYLLSNPSQFEVESEIQHKLCSFLFDCASNERLEFLSPLMNLIKQSRHYTNDNSNSLWQIKVANSCAHNCHSLRSDFVDSIRSITEKRIKSILNHLKEWRFNSLIADSIDKNKLWLYLKGTLNIKEINTSLIEAIVFYDMPPFGSMASISGIELFVKAIINMLSLNFDLRQSLICPIGPNNESGIRNTYSHNIFNP